MGEEDKRKAAPELPAYIQNRIAVWDELIALRAEENKEKYAVEKKITITLPDGKTVEGIAGKTTALDIAGGISEGLKLKVVAAKINGKVMDSFRPLEEDCSLKLLTFDSPEGEFVFWHSSAHVLGQSLELTYDDARLCIGPPIEDGGFYYDVNLPEKKAITPDDFKKLESRISKIVKKKQPFVRLELEKDEALRMFANNKFKQEIIQNKVPDGERCTAYRCGPLIDLCRGPHIPNTGKIKAMSVTKNSSSYWLGNANNPSLQRVYGISFPDKKKLKEYKLLIKEAEKRDHRKVGAAQSLFFFHKLSPGSCFFLPHGTRIYNKLQDFIRAEYRKRGYDEVITPNVYNIDLWKTSGHYANYKENMFTFKCEGVEFGMKPMNCPGHCLVFGNRLRSYRELPIRMADFGVLHRNELSGALTGLTRVRRFQQDDAHIFCRQDQIEAEVGGVLDMLETCYGIFGFTFDLQLSTRPAKYLGEIEMWDKAEKALANCLDTCGRPWTINPADGAFYGPKIDIQLTDALRRKHQCATIQLDFQLPIRFELSFKSEEDGKFERPVMIHRAILGSVERMIAVLTEHTGGKWPLWLSPRQLTIVPVALNFLEYAQKVQKAMDAAGFYCDIEDSQKQFKKKIRDCQVAQYNYILVVGAQEVEDGTVNIRNRDNATEKEVLSVEAAVAKFQDLVAKYA